MVFTVTPVTGVWAKCTFSSYAFNGTDIIRKIIFNNIIQNLFYAQFGDLQP